MICGGKKHRLHVVAALPSHHHAQCGQHTRGCRTYDARDLKRVGDVAGVHRARTTKRDQHAGPGIDAALHTHHAERPHHLRDGHSDDALGALHRAKTECLAECRYSLERPHLIEVYLAPGTEIPGHATKHHIGVGDRGLRATEAVCGGPRNRRGRVRPHP